MTDQEIFKELDDVLALAIDAIKEDIQKRETEPEQLNIHMRSLEMAYEILRRN